ncbi:MAG: virulence protein [Eubacteriales bacterium]|nr:virulence protein [Eubacteriales bacterium]
MMYAIIFDLKIDVLKEEYGESYNVAYDEVKKELLNYGFEWVHGSVYINHNLNNVLPLVYKAIEKLSMIHWFKKSVRDIKVCKVEEWSDFTEIVKN